MKVNLGCGSQIFDGWVNVDNALGAYFMKYSFFRMINKKLQIFNLDWNDEILLHDLTTTFPWADSTVEVVYSCHTLEHLTKNEGHHFLSECHRVLRKNGIIRLVVPDLLQIVCEYIEGRLLADDFVEQLGVLYGSSSNRIKRRLSPFFECPHKCMYDSLRLINILNQIGFEAYTRGAFESDIQDINMIELESRTQNAVIVEGRKR